ncbi:unnamed protein product [Brugia pahangi]|uniref:Uncharacterized protein n=1 Tax=Brugia pahangi TaxID=6280 RepID=A0A0N4TN48_BRUPA|nr:unnamed protein product [Brugia pahangi]
MECVEAIPFVRKGTVARLISFDESPLSFSSAFANNTEGSFRCLNYERYVILEAYRCLESRNGFSGTTVRLATLFDTWF